MRNRIIRICGDVPRAELFARQKVAGWSAWGNEVACDFTLSPADVSLLRPGACKYCQADAKHI